MSYYHEHAKDFIEDTFNCDMSNQYLFFEKFLKKQGKILDIGFGSGRDSLYFISKGYDVYSIDPEPKFIEYAKSIGLEHVYEMKAEDINFENMFDAIWACASLLHLPSNNLQDVFIRCSKALLPGGIMYVSFKYGDFEGYRNGRFYLDMNENLLSRYINDTNLQILEINKSIDNRPNRNDEWMNICLIKSNLNI